MSKNEQNAQEPKELTEWQKRNLEFLKKKQSEESQADEERKAQLAKRNPQADVGESHEAEQDVQEDLDVEKRRRFRFRDVRISIKRNKSKKNRVPKGRQSLAMLIVFIATLAILFSLFLISPWSKEKVLRVSGVQNALAADVITASGIKDSDYLTQVFLNQSEIASRVEANNVWVRKASLSYQFPNTFNIAIKEYPIVAYRQTANGYVSILETGKTGGTVSSSNLPERFITINLDNEEQVKAVIDQLNKLTASLKNEIRIINLTPTTATADLLTLEMYDGTTVRVPLSQLATKLPYYDKIREQHDDSNIIDMEVGIYTTTSEIESSPSQSENEGEQNPETPQESESADESDSGLPTAPEAGGNATDIGQIPATETPTELGQ